MPTSDIARGSASAREAMMHAAQRRLRPILMTATAAICGMLPLAFALGSGSQMLQPLAIAVIGGLMISMALSLIVTPVVYYLLTRSPLPKSHKIARDLRSRALLGNDLYSIFRRRGFQSAGTMLGRGCGVVAVGAPPNSAGHHIYASGRIVQCHCSGTPFCLHCLDCGKSRLRCVHNAQRSALAIRRKCEFVLRIEASCVRGHPQSTLIPALTR